MDISNFWKIGAALSFLVGPVLAQEQYSCAGVDPDWSLEISGNQATFSYVAADMLNIPQRSVAEGRDWPKALTLMGGRDTAIVILTEQACSTSQITNYPLNVNVLTQKAETPVILTGCCTRP